MIRVMMHAKNSSKLNMESKNSLEEQVNALQRQMEGIAKLLKDLKSSVEYLEKKDRISKHGNPCKH